MDDKYRGTPMTWDTGRHVARLTILLVCCVGGFLGARHTLEAGKILSFDGNYDIEIMRIHGVFMGLIDIHGLFMGLIGVL